MILHLLNADGTRGEEVDYNNDNDDQLLGVLLKTETLDRIGLVGHFFVSKFVNKAAVLQIRQRDLAKFGALVLFSRTYYEASNANRVLKNLSLTSFEFVDESPFYRGFEVHNMFRVNLVDYLISKIADEKNAGCRYFVHPIFGKVSFYSEKIELNEEEVYPFIGLESTTPTSGLKKLSYKQKEAIEKSKIQPNRKPSFANMKFRVKVIPVADADGNIVHERIVRENGRLNDENDVDGEPRVEEDEEDGNNE